MPNENWEERKVTGEEAIAPSKRLIAEACGAVATILPAIPAPLLSLMPWSRVDKHTIACFRKAQPVQHDIAMRWEFANGKLVQ